MELILVVVISAGTAENSQNGVSRFLKTWPIPYKAKPSKNKMEYDKSDWLIYFYDQQKVNGFK